MSKILHLQLDRDPDGFANQIPSFVRELASHVDVHPGELSLVEVREGCLIVLIAASDATASSLINTFASRTKSEDSDVFDRWGVSLLREVAPWRLTSELSISRAEPNLSMLPSEPGIDWLHISDLHAAALPETGQLHDWMTDFLLDLPDLLSASKLQPRFILVSGDLANTGVPDEYHAVELFLERVRAELPQSDVPIVAVPGNHDVAWSEISPPEELKLRLEVDSDGSDGVIEALSGENDDESPLGRRHAAFDAFATDLDARLDQSPTAHGFARSWRINLDGLDVGIVGFNSALLSTRGDLLEQLGERPDVAQMAGSLDFQHLAVGQKHLRSAYSAISQCDLRIAVLHHPPFSDWFREDDQRHQRGWLSRFDFIHRGHQHLASSDARRPVAVSSETLEIATGALHTDSRSYRGFAVVSLVASQQMEGLQMARVTHWSYGGSADRWHLDNLASPTGGECLVLPEDLVRRLSKR